MSRKRILAFHILLPLFGGMCIYLFFSQNVFFVKTLYNIFDNLPHLQLNSRDSFFLQLLRNYFPDMMWAYALAFAIYCALGRHAATWGKALMIAMTFSAFLELLQLTSFYSGVFDIWDIAVEWLAEMVAALVIQKNCREEV